MLQCIYTIIATSITMYYIGLGIIITTRVVKHYQRFGPLTEAFLREMIIHKRHTRKKWQYSNLTATECSDGMPNDGDIYNVRGILMTNEKTKCPIYAKSSHPALYSSDSLLANV